MWFCLCDPTFSGFSRTPTCDRQTQTQTHGQYRACIASRGKNWQWTKIRQTWWRWRWAGGGEQRQQVEVEVGEGVRLETDDLLGVGRDLLQLAVALVAALDDADADDLDVAELHEVGLDDRLSRIVRPPVRDDHHHLPRPPATRAVNPPSPAMHRATVTLFCSISMPVDFCRHLVDKNSQKCFLAVIALK